MKGKNFLAGLVATGLASLPIYHASAQTYDSLKTVQVANELKSKGFQLKGTMVNNPFQFQVDYGGKSKLINTQIFADKSENDKLMIYPIFVAFNKNNAETQSEKSFVDSYGGFGFIMDDNNVSPSVYADSIASLLEGNTTGIESQNKSKLESKLENIYPNPTNGMINVKYNLTNSQNVNFEVYEVLGKKVYSTRGESGETTKRINTGELPSGTYFLRMTSGKEKSQEIKKFIILR
ncbi:hypothetical protein CO037_02380 [Candidatus Pacearchaeota archaeon CG_4_9_14_0_2_um_filter_30_8]|nr:MAG: hypothetical protein CO037_02380 [Candidatus Pacearchaeota archaeon CG_4_9_14_0_2_um_filter_30_8]